MTNERQKNTMALTNPTKDNLNNNNSNNNKKRKKYVSNSEKSLKYKQNTDYFQKLPTEKQEELFLIVYIKTLFEVYKTLPNIIAIIDRIIEKRATTIFPSSCIYGNPFSTYNEINKVIDLTERKDKILNLYVITENLFNALKEKHKQIAELKYVKKLTVEEIAIETQKSVRSVYRSLSTITSEILKFLKLKNWNSAFFKSQIGEEGWIEEIFTKKLQSQIDIEIRNLNSLQ